MKALIIDDSAIIRRIFVQILRTLKISSTAVDSGIEALQILERDNSYDFALIDYSMPTMTGADFVEKVRKNHRNDKIKLLIITAGDSIEHAKRAKQVGADDFMIKPVNKSILKEKLKFHGLN